MWFGGIGAVVVAVVLATAAASAGAAGDATVPAQRCRAGTLQRLIAPKVAYAAIVRRPVAVRRRPDGPAFAHFGRRNVNGVRTVFGVWSGVVGPDCSAEWYRVQLPLRPNGATGYVRASRVRLARVFTRISVDLSARRLTLLRSGRPLLRARVAIGAPDTPTPTGRYYVNQRLLAADPSGPYGPGALGVSAFSRVLTGWTQGGPIAIHGTNQPWSIGHAISNGCVRVRNAIVRKLFRLAYAGTPVVIHP